MRWLSLSASLQLCVWLHKSIYLFINPSILLPVSNWSCPLSFLSLLLLPICLISLPSIYYSVSVFCPHYSLSVFFNPHSLPLIILLSPFSLLQALLCTLVSHLANSHCVSPFLRPSSSQLVTVKCDSRSIGEVWWSTHTGILIYTTKPELQMQWHNMATFWQQRLLPQWHISVWQHRLAMETSSNIYISCTKYESLCRIGCFLLNAQSSYKSWLFRGPADLCSLLLYTTINQLLSQPGHIQLTPGYGRVIPPVSSRWV